MRGCFIYYLYTVIASVSQAQWSPAGDIIMTRRAAEVSSDTGIGQTVWIKSVPNTAVSDIEVTPDTDKRLVHIEVSVPDVDVLLPNAKQGRYTWRYTLEKPAVGWFMPDFDDSYWETGVGGFGTEITRGALIGTVWNSSGIWLRREFELERTDFRAVLLSVHHNENAMVYINGTQAATLPGRTNEYTLSDVSNAAKNALRKGRNVIAVYCNHVAREQFIDVGLLAVDDQGEEDFYVNPVIDHLADPSILQFEGTYYLYPTGGAAQGYRVYTSKNLVNWTQGPVIYRSDRSRVMAPHVWRDPDSGRFYLYWTVDECVGVAVSDSPAGPFEDVREFVCRAIDAHFFRDNDGTLYLYYVKFPGFRITVQPMESPVEPKGEPVTLLQPESDWEMRHDRVTEAPWMLKHNQKYYLLYSGTHTKSPHYAIGYAVADNPTGPFTRAPNNPIVQRDATLFGPGHCSVAKDGDGKMWLLYHQKRTDDMNYDRFICIDPIRFDADGLLRVDPSRGSRRPAPVPLD